MSRLIGNMIEDHIIEKFGMVRAQHNDYHDAWLLRTPVEIKGVLRRPLNKNSQLGRIWITNANHKKLVLTHGLYCIVLYDFNKDVIIQTVHNMGDIEIIHILFIAAYRIPIGNGKNTKIVYTKLLNDY